MMVRVQMFAAARQLAGADVVTVELPDEATVAQLRQALVAQVPALAGMIRHLMFAVAAEYAADTTPLSPAAEVACIPPVSGG